MIIRVSFMVVASVAALKISQTKTKTNGTIKSQANKGSDGSHLEHEFEERENSTAAANHVIQNEEEKQNKIEMPQNLLAGEFEDCELLIGAEKMDYVTEKELLQNLIENYKQREMNLERKLVELNSLKEEQSAIAQMQRQLEEKTEKLDSLKKTIVSLQSERKIIIQEKTREDVLSKMQLDIANKIINEMQRKKGMNGSPVKDQMLVLQQVVTELEKHNGSGGNDVVNKKIRDVQNMELEVLELKRRNKELELEKREIGFKLDTAQAKIRTEEETVAQIQEEIAGLRNVHEDLLEQVEILQRNRFDMVEELVYQRWLYTCLRFEVHDHQKQMRKKASRQYCSQNSGKEELYEKTRALLTSDPEYDSITSNASFNESDEVETTTTLESSSSSSSQSSSSKNSSLVNKIKRWKKSKDYNYNNNNKISPKGSRNSTPSSLGLIRRFSMSMVESDISKPRKSGGDSYSSVMMNLPQKIKMKTSSNSPEKPIIPRLRRVPFSDDLVKPSSSYQDATEEAEDGMDDKETNYGKIMELTSSTVTSLNEHKTVTEQYDKPSHKSNEYAVGNNPINIDSPSENEGTKNQIGDSDELHSKNDRIKTQLLQVQLLAFFFFSLILLLAYLSIK